MIKLLIFVLFAILFGGCTTIKSDLPKGTEAYQVIPAYEASKKLPDYKLGAFDVIKIVVFQEPDLSFDELPVDSTGNIYLPLIGQVSAIDKTSLELSREISQRLGSRYLVEPSVSVNVFKSASQKITVEGAVIKPGIFPIEGSSNLLQAMALASGPTETAKIDEVIVFRTIGGQIYGAQFDLDKIRKGSQPNPEILGSDTVVVGASFAKALFRDLLKLSPVLASVFIQLTR